MEMGSEWHVIEQMKYVKYVWYSRQVSPYLLWWFLSFMIEWQVQWVWHNHLKATIAIEILII